MKLQPGPVLRDIHLPPSPGWWPPAPGWWLLATLLLLAIFLLVRRIRRDLPPRRRWRAVSDELARLEQRWAADGDAASFAAGVSQLLRRAARTREPAAVGVYGDAWHATLQRLAPDAGTAQPLLTLDAALYRPQSVLQVDAVTRAARVWLRYVLLSGVPRG